MFNMIKNHKEGCIEFKIWRNPGTTFLAQWSCSTFWLNKSLFLKCFWWWCLREIYPLQSASCILVHASQLPGSTKQPRGEKRKPAKCTLYLGVIRSQNTDSEIGTLLHQLIVSNIKPFPIKLSLVAGKLQIILVNIFFCVSKKNPVCYISATYKCLCTSACS